MNDQSDKTSAACADAIFGYATTKRASFAVETNEAPTMPDIKFPPHKASLHLTHNQHLAYYRTVAESIEDGDHGYIDDWVSPEQRQKAIDTNECWSLQWYPETPVGFCMLSAADLDVLLTAALAD